MGLLAFLKDKLSGGAYELSRDDLLRQVVGRIAELARHGARGRQVLPAEVVLEIEVGEGSVEVIREFVADPEFDQEVESRLLNRLDAVGSLPIRRYKVRAGARHRITVRESTDQLQLRLRFVSGADEGRTVVLPASKRELRLGRGPHHGNDADLANDVAVTAEQPFVSRRAARLLRQGARLTLEALDQGDCLVVVRQDGNRLRPARTATGTVPLVVGDVVEFNDGGTQHIQMLVEAVAAAGEDAS